MGIPYQRHKPSAVLRKFLDPLDPGPYFDCGRARLHGIDDVLLREAERRGRAPGEDTFQLVATDIGLIFCRPSISFAIAARWADVVVSRPVGDDSVVLNVVWPTHGELSYTVGKRLGGNIFRRWLQLQMQATRADVGESNFKSELETPGTADADADVDVDVDTVNILADSVELPPAKVSDPQDSATSDDDPEPPSFDEAVTEHMAIAESEPFKTIVWHEGEQVNLVEQFQLSDPGLEAKRLKLTDSSSSISDVAVEKEPTELLKGSTDGSSSSPDTTSTDSDGTETSHSSEIGIDSGKSSNVEDQARGKRPTGKVSLLELLASDEQGGGVQVKGALGDKIVPTSRPSVLAKPASKEPASTVEGKSAYGSVVETDSTSTELEVTANVGSVRESFDWLPPESVGDTSISGGQPDSGLGLVERPIVLAMAVVVIGVFTLFTLISRLGPSSGIAEALDGGTATLIDNQRFKSGFEDSGQDSETDEEGSSQSRSDGPTPASPRRAGGESGTIASVSAVELAKLTRSTSSTTQVPSGAKTQIGSVLCNSNYSGCVPDVSDVDCQGDGDGPAFLDESVIVLGTDVYLLDTDDDGSACEPGQPNSSGRLANSQLDG